MSLLDQILDGPRVVHDEHDTNNVAVSEGDVATALRGLAGPRGWDAAEYGITQAQAEQMLRDADTPEARARVVLDLKRRALNRAGLDVSTGKVAALFAGRPGWHRLGTTVEGVFTSAEAVRLAPGVNFAVVKEAMAYRGRDGSWVESDDVFSLKRADTGYKLGTVGARYKPIQNAEAFAFLDTLLEEFGARYESVGSVYNGEKVWMLVHLPEQSFRVNGTDVNEAYALFLNPHDGSGKALCFPTNERVECANTMRSAVRGRKDKGLGIRHTGDVRGKIAEARKSLGLSVRALDEYREKAEALAEAKVTTKQAEYYFEDVLDAALDITAADAKKGADLLAAALDVTEAQRTLEAKSIQKKIDRREGILEDILTRYESRANGKGGMRGTAWGVFNAVTESADHGKLGGRYKGDPEKKASRQMAETLYGAADDVKQTALDRALALTA